MTATTQDLSIPSRAANRLSLGLAGAAVLFAGALVCRDSSGNAVDGSDATGLAFAGLAYAPADNTDGAAGDIEAEFITSGVHLLTAAGLAAGDEGRAVYLLDNQTVVLSGHASLDYHIYVGRIWKVVSATQAWVEIRPGEKDPNEVLTTLDVAGANAAALTTNLNAAVTAAFGSAYDGVYVKAVHGVQAYVTADGTSAGRKVVTTNYTLASGVITTVTNESANRLFITLRGVLKQS